MEPRRTTLVNLAFADGNAIYIGRAGKGLDGKFGNPANIAGDRHDARRRIEAVKAFLYYFRHRMGLVWNERWSKAGVPSNDKEWKLEVSGLRGKTLACPGNCLPALCHGLVYVAWLDGGPVGLAKLEERIKTLESLS